MREQLPQLPHVRVDALAGELDLVQRREERQHRRERDAEREELRAGHLRPVRVEHDRMDELLRQPDREERDRDQHDAEQRVDRAHVRARAPRLEREAQHEVRAVEEEEHEEQHELVLAPRPPHAPRRARPDRAGQQRQRAEDHALVDRDVALEVGALVALPEHAQRLPGAPAEAGVGGQGDRHVEVEDPLREALVGVGRGVEEDQRDRGAEQHDRQSRHRSRHGSLRASSHGAIVVRRGSPFGDDVLERRPGEHARRSRRRARGTTGSRRRRRRRSGSRQAGRAGAAAARGRGRRPPSPRTASRRRRCRRRRARPPRPCGRRSRRRTPRRRAARRPRPRRETRSTAIDLPSQIALRSHGARTSASNIPCSRSATNARVRPSSAVKMSAAQSRPSAAW